MDFVYKIESKPGESRTERIRVPNTSGKEAGFNFSVDFRREEIELEDKIEYYFVVYDNDCVNGSKYSDTRHHERHES